MNLTNPPYYFTQAGTSGNVGANLLRHPGNLSGVDTATNRFQVSLENAEAGDGGGGSGDHDYVGTKVIKGILLSMCILVAISGNLLVVTAVLTERRLKRVKNNYFIVSLAVADLLVACVVMTFAVPNEIQGQWVFGEVFCQFWISFDIMCSTASILNLCVISFDRYKHIHNAMYYDTWMTTRKALLLIFSVWVLSALISFLPIHLGWHTVSHDSDPQPPLNLTGSRVNTTGTTISSVVPLMTTTDAASPLHYNITDSSSNYSSSSFSPSSSSSSDDFFECAMELNFIYALISSTISFYVPCLVMLVIYFKLFLFARAHAVSIRSMKRPALMPTSGNRQPVSNGSNRSSLRASDHKAAFTLGVITGVFLVCWLPFFIINPIAAYNQKLISLEIFTIVTWAGYANSCLNPVIYSIFNTEFREAFKKILSFRMCRRDAAYLPSSSSRSCSNRSKFKKADYEAHTTDNGSIIRKTSKDLLFNEKVTKL